MVPTVKVKPWGEGQGDFVIINEEDFDPKQHTLHEEEGAPKASKSKKAKADDAGSKE